MFVVMEINLLIFLVKHAYDIVDYCSWIEESPCFIEQALLHNVSNDFFYLMKFLFVKKKSYRWKLFYFFVCGETLTNYLI